jgi:uncharacterized protein YggE
MKVLPLPFTGVFVIALFASIHAEPSVAQPLQTITVTGVGEIKTTPDGATFQVGIQVAHAEAKAALSEANKVIKALHRTLNDARVAPRQVQTVQFNVSPQYEGRRDGQPASLVGYRVRRVLSATTTELDALGNLLDSLITAGANVLDSVRFINTETAPLYNNARHLAVKDAQRRADTLAAAAGRKRGKLLQIQEGTTSIPAPPMPRARMALAGGAPVAAGENRFRVTVGAQYALD